MRLVSLAELLGLAGYPARSRRTAGRSRIANVRATVGRVLMPVRQVKPATSITKSARETPSVHHVGMPAKRRIVVRHGKWAVDVVACRDHREVRQGVCEGLEGGQGQDPGSGGAGHRLVTRQCPAPAE